ncbi:MAG: 50S ribosomal protein L6, partial [Candidatus Aenigmarchaeota archaeon]|nr:50S ribosomal protein L6 [Candidatus Aenigmarchaeota archaeon]
MEKELTIPENVKVEVQNKHVKVSGPKGELNREFKYFFDVKIEKKDNKIVVTSSSDIKKVRAITGTIIAHIN